MSNVVKQEKTSLLESIGKQWGVGEVDPKKLYETLKATAFKPIKKGDGFVQVTDDQLMALLIVSKQYNLNPFLKEIYAFPAKDGSIVPVVGVDGWANIINNHPQMDGIEYRYSENIKTMPGAKPCPEWIECVITRKDRSKPIVVREYLDECYKEERYPGPWQSHTKRFLRHKATIQGGRIAFGFSGIYDPDEADNFKDVTPVVSLPKESEIINKTMLEVSPPEIEQVEEIQLDIPVIEFKTDAGNVMHYAQAIIDAIKTAPNYEWLVDLNKINAENLSKLESSNSPIHKMVIAAFNDQVEILQNEQRSTI